jgi:large subunit ribosomal protein L15
MEIRDMNELTRLTPPRGGGVKEKKRVGRGQASGTGKTAGRGGKGQKARTGNMNFIGFEGGQMPIQRRQPKRGFTNPFRVEYALVNVGALEGLGLAEVDLDKLVEVGAVKDRKGGLKILGDGELTKAVSVRAHRFSGSAKEKIEKAGGKAEVIVVAPKVTPQQRKAEEKKAAASAKKELR